jgi:hypothetical protein
MTQAVSLVVKKGNESITYDAVDWKTISAMVQAFNRAKTPEEKKKIINQIVVEVQRQHYEQDVKRDAERLKQRYKRGKE